MSEVILHTIPYILIPSFGIYIVYEFVKLLILNYKKRHGKG
jgi:hypothetical protein